MTTITTPATATGIHPSPAESSDGERAIVGGTGARGVDPIGGRFDGDQFHASGSVLRQLGRVEQGWGDRDASPATR